jgi:uncharacterized tellurite resistance protein B-like protein
MSWGGPADTLVRATENRLAGGGRDRPAAHTTVRSGQGALVMLDRLLRLLEGRDTPAVPSQEDLRLAVAALLVEAAHMDETFSDTERATIASLLSKRFELSDHDVSALIERAGESAGRSTEYFRLTHNINLAMSAGERAEVIEMLWRVAYADGVLDGREVQLIRQIAGLIDVTDQARMLARKRALEG